VYLKGSGGFSSPLQDIAGAWLFSRVQKDIDDLYFGIFVGQIGNNFKGGDGLEGSEGAKVCGARSLREKNFSVVKGYIGEIGEYILVGNEMSREDN